MAASQLSWFLISRHRLPLSPMLAVKVVRGDWRSQSSNLHHLLAITSPLPTNTSCNSTQNFSESIVNKWIQEKIAIFDVDVDLSPPGTTTSKNQINKYCCHYKRKDILNGSFISSNFSANFNSEESKYHPVTVFKRRFHFNSLKNTIMESSSEPQSYHSTETSSIKKMYKNQNFLTQFLCRKFTALAEQNNNIQNPYTLAIEKLNCLQSNANYIKQAYHGKKSNSLEKTNYYLSSLGINSDDLNKLKIIHVAGTKGKGSTCAFVESILRANGYKTGFYSSPHLVVVRERIRLNGKPIPEDKFSYYFDQVYNKVERAYTEEFGMLGYFNFLTVMAFHVFLKEGVDVAIMEVGIGGELDCTNVVTKPIVTGVTSLDYDHCKMLGNTLADIAAQKAGIFKPGVPALTVQQPEEAMNVLKNVAKQVQAPFYIVPPWSLYPGSSRIDLGIKGEAQKLNASLAVQLCNLWLNKMKSNKIVCSYLTNDGCFLDAVALNQNNFTIGLSQTVWHGRCEIIQKESVKYFLDGAHTTDSISNCCQWFIEQSYKNSSTKTAMMDSPKQQDNEISHTKWRNFFKHHHHHNYHPVNCKINAEDNSQSCLKDHEQIIRILVFNCTGERNPEPLLKKLSTMINFDMAIFTTNRLEKEKHLDSDCSNLTITNAGEDSIRLNNMKTWMKLNMEGKTFQVDCIRNAIDQIESIAKLMKQTNAMIHVLVCGSVHLVGGFINLLHPKYFDSDF